MKLTRSTMAHGAGKLVPWVAGLLVVVVGSTLAWWLLPHNGWLEFVQRVVVVMLAIQVSAWLRARRRS